MNFIFYVSACTCLPLMKTQGESSSVFLPFLELSDSASVFTGVDDGSTLLTFPQPFYFNSISYDSAHISSNGLVSFGSSFTSWSPRTFPLSSLSDPPVIAPYWDDIDLRSTGNVYYESVSDLSMISDFITDSEGLSFTCTSAVVVEWSEVCPYGNRVCGNMTNSFQVVLASSQYNHTSYAIFTYECGSLNWVNHKATIGFSGGQDFYANHNLSQTIDVNDIACLNEPTSPWSNVVYKVNEARVYSEFVTTAPTEPINAITMTAITTSSSINDATSSTTSMVESTTTSTTTPLAATRTSSSMMHDATTSTTSVSTSMMPTPSPSGASCFVAPHEGVSIAELVSQVEQHFSISGIRLALPTGLNNSTVVSAVAVCVGPGVGSGRNNVVADVRLTEGMSQQAEVILADAMSEGAMCTSC